MITEFLIHVKQNSLVVKYSHLRLVWLHGDE